jgi:DNA-binding transcriptional LysR family regulator
MLRRVDDLILLTQVVEAGSFTAASKATGISKARLSRRIGDLEIELGVRLIERTTRSFRITDVGRRLYGHGCTIRTESEAARALVNGVVLNPSGALNIACPVVLAEQVVNAAAVEFADRYREVELTFDVVNGEPNITPEHYDLMFLPSNGSLRDSSIVAKLLMRTPFELVANEEWIKSVGTPRCAADLEGLSGIGWWQVGIKPKWKLHDEAGREYDVSISPRVRTNNLTVVHQAALKGLGMARLPQPLCLPDLRTGRLKRVVPELSAEAMHIYVAYASRQSLTTAGRAFLDILDRHIQSYLAGPIA